MQDTASLDSGQYSRRSIAKYEAIYGEHFISPGGAQMMQECLSLVPLSPNMSALDVGCGIGGAAFLLAKQHGVTVHGIDLSANMLEVARERCEALHLTDKVTLSLGDILQYQAPAPYDLIYSRDVFLHIQEKEKLFAVIRRALKPGGWLLFTDYCCGEGAFSEEFSAYLAQRGYALATVKQYRALLESGGFVDVSAQDRTEQFIQILEEELSRIEHLSFDEHTKQELSDAWKSKITRAKQGEQRWGLFVARLSSD
jgi:phosphoethanolamine N-methyltransferase